MPLTFTRYRLDLRVGNGTVGKASETNVTACL
jgi:hypothetical protein